MKPAKLLTSLLYLVFLVVAVGPACAARKTTDDMLIIVGASLISGTGDKILEDTVVYIHDGLITRIEVVSDGDYPDGPNVILAHGKFLIPGLVESHAHIDHLNGIGLDVEQKKIAREYNPVAFLYNGVTTVISMSSHDLDWVQQQQKRALEGAALPRNLTGGEHFTIPGGWGGRHGGGVTSGAEVERRMKELSEAGVDLIKIIYENGLGETPIFGRLSPDLVAQIAALGKEKGLPVFIHATDGEEYATAIKVAPRAIVHGLLTPLERNEGLINDLRKQDIYVVPTIVLFEAFTRFLDSPELLQDPYLMASVPDFVLKSVSNKTRLFAALKKMDKILKMDTTAWVRNTLSILKENTRKFAEAGIPLVVGADSGGAVVHAFQGYNTPREMELLEDCCLSPMETIVAATRNGAKMIGRGQNFGTLEVGKIADILILNKNPLTDIRNVRDFDLIILRGKLVKRSSLTFHAFMHNREFNTGKEK